MARYMPPGYKQVRRKVAPTPSVRSQVPQETQNILQKQKELQEAMKKQASGTANPAAEEAAANKEAAKAEKVAAAQASRAAKKAATKAAKKEPAAKKASKKAAKKTTKKAAKKAAAKFPKWSPDDNRDKLYKLAKKIGLESVVSRDTKDWIVKELTKAEKKASK